MKLKVLLGRNIFFKEVTILSRIN